MPEGDTVHRAATALQPLVGDQLSVTAIHPRARATGVAERVDGKTLQTVEARGKNLLLGFGGGIVLRSHLGMTGSWRVVPADVEVRGRPWLVLRGSRAQAVLRGGARLALSKTSLRLGPDILDDPPDASTTVANILAAEPGRPIADVLLDQAVVAGIGNIWRSEALWAARVSPLRPIDGVTAEEALSVVAEAHRLMTSSSKGEMLPRGVYRRAGRPCRRCGTPIQSRRLGEHARAAYWCPTCQPAARGDGPASA